MLGAHRNPCQEPTLQQFHQSLQDFILFALPWALSKKLQPLYFKKTTKETCCYPVQAFYKMKRYSCLFLAPHPPFYFPWLLSKDTHGKKKKPPPSRAQQLTRKHSNKVFYLKWTIDWVPLGSARILECLRMCVLYSRKALGLLKVSNWLNFVGCAFCTSQQQSPLLCESHFMWKSIYSYEAIFFLLYLFY